MRSGLCFELVAMLTSREKKNEAALHTFISPFVYNLSRKTEIDLHQKAINGESDEKSNRRRIQKPVFGGCGICQKRGKSRCDILKEETNHRILCPIVIVC